MQRDCPADAIDARDLRTCDARAEIDRCLRILAWLDATPVSSFLRLTPPQASETLISVVVPMYNARAWIDLCLKGLLAQTHTDLEIFCVDDGSSDDTYERVVGQFGADQRICAIKLRRNVGPYQIKNWVIGSLARGAWIALQDADDVSHPLRFAAQREWTVANGYRVSGTGAHQFFPPGMTLPLGLGAPLDIDGMLHNLAFFPSVERNAAPSLRTESSEERAGPAFVDAYRAGPYKVYAQHLTDHGTQMMQRSLFLEFGGFDGRTRFAADSEFNARVIRFEPIGNLPNVLYSRRFHPRSLTQEPATHMASTGRKAYRAQRALRDANLQIALSAGDTARARAMCTADLYFGDVEVREMHSGFAVTERLSRRLDG